MRYDELGCYCPISNILTVYPNGFCYPSGGPVDKDQATTFFIVEVIIVWVAIWAIQPREKLAGYILWLGILILVLGVGTDAGWFQGYSMKFAGITITAVSSYYIYLGAYLKGQKDERERHL